jgi:hypothetical protein
MPGASPVYSVFLYIEIRDRRPNGYPAGKPVKSLWPREYATGAIIVRRG